MEGEDYDYIDDDVGCRDGGVDGGVGGGFSGEVRGIFKEKYLYNILIFILARERLGSLDNLSLLEMFGSNNPESTNSALLAFRWILKYYKHSSPAE